MKKSQKKILPHSQAKLDLYQKYLEKYFAILGLAKSVTKVNIYDLFCGTGIYEDGKEGSPILAFRKIQENRAFFKKNNWSEKPITLTVNDSDPLKITSVQQYIDSNNKCKVCDLSFTSEEVATLFPKLVDELSAQDDRERNLLFIDPYGYKEINAQDIDSLLSNRRTEIILFLPVSFMHRFKNISLLEDRKCYQALNKFICSLFPPDHDIMNLEKMSISKFIHYLQEGLSFKGKYYCVSHSIERTKGNQFAVFFLSSHIYGLERMLTVKWDSDTEFGTGYRTPKAQGSLFEEVEKQEIENENYVWLSRRLYDFLKERHTISNLELYEFTLKMAFLPKHTNSILFEWNRQGDLCVRDAQTKMLIDKPRSFFNKWNDYRTKQPKILISFKDHGT